MFELNARPWSPWINVFTPEEWVAFNYVNGLWFYHCFGYVYSIARDVKNSLFTN